MWRYQRAATEFSNDTWACHQGCAAQTRWRVISTDAEMIPLQVSRGGEGEVTGTSRGVGECSPSSTHYSSLTLCTLSLSLSLSLSLWLASLCRGIHFHVCLSVGRTPI